MASFRRLICATLALVVSILFAGILELFCTPCEEWFLELCVPYLFVSPAFHNTLWLLTYLSIAWALSLTIVKRDYIGLLLWAVFFVLSIVAVALVFSAKSLLFSPIPLILATVLLVLLSARVKHSSFSLSFVICCYVYLLGLLCLLIIQNN